VRWRRYRILAGRGLVGEYVRVEEGDNEVALYYAATQIRRLRLSGPPRGPML